MDPSTGAMVTTAVDRHNEIMEYSTIRVRHENVVSVWEKDCLTGGLQTDARYWGTSSCSSVTAAPATCYKGVRSRVRACESDTGSCSSCTDSGHNDDPRCTHMPTTIQQKTQREWTTPLATEGGLPNCGMLIKYVLTPR